MIRLTIALSLLGPALAISLGPPPGAAAQSNPPMPPVALPKIPAHRVVLSSYGAVGDGKADDAGAFQKALAALRAAGGGTLEVPPGRYWVRPLTLISRLDLHLDRGATLLMDTDPGDYQAAGRQNRQCIEAAGCQDVALTGDGTIDGQGASWWPRYVKTYVPPPGTPALMHRPYMVVFSRCTRVLVQGVTLTNSPSFHLVPDQCRDVMVKDVHILAAADAPNTDGIDPSGWNYHITGCTFDVGDDCIAVKPGRVTATGQPSCENFLIENCTFLHGHGLSIGGQSRGGLRRMTVRNCTFDGTQAGIRMKAPRGAGGLVEDVAYADLTMNNVKVPIFITSYYPKAPADPAQDPAQPVDSRTPIWRHIRIRNMTSTGSPTAGIILGLPEMPVSDVELTNVRITADKGITITHARGIRFVNSQITVRTGTALLAQDADVTGLPAGARR